MDSIESVRKFYDDSPETEWERLSYHRVEYDMTMRFISRYIKPGCKVLDVGGGPGRYSIALSKLGCNTALFDLSSGNLALAKEKAKDEGVRLKTICGDARFLDSYIDDQYDILLLMGPLYHLLREEDRVAVMNSALKILKPGGVIFCAFISSFSAVYDFYANFPEAVGEQNSQKYFDLLSEDRSYSGMSFTESHFSSPSEAVQFMGQFPLKKLHYLGIEGFLLFCEKQLYSQPADIYDGWLDYTESICEKPEVINMAHHLLYVGEKL